MYRKLTILTVLSLLLAVPAFTSAAGGIANGNFETGDLSGWTSISRGDGNWYAYSGTTSPASSQSIASPPEGTFAAVTDQNGPGSHILLQNLAVPADGNATLSFMLYYENRAENFSTPATLDHNISSPNQQYRVDLLNASAPADSVAPGDVRSMLFRTNVGDNRSMPPTRMCYALAPFAGENLQLRFAMADNQFFFHASVDDVRVESGAGCPPPPPPPPKTVDLTVTAVLAPTNVSVGQQAFVTAGIANLGTQPAPAFTVEFRLDNAVFARKTFGPGMPAGLNTTTSAWTPTLTGSGYHMIEVVVDPENNVTETNESNNARRTLVFVNSAADARVYLQMEPVLVPTEAGDVRHPLGRHEATLTTCNFGPDASVSGWANIMVRGGANGTFGTGSVSLGSRSVPALAAGNCVVDRFQFDTPGVIGDFTLAADLFIPSDRPDGNHAEVSGFRGVGDQGGVVLPSGARMATNVDLSPQVAVVEDLVQRTPGNAQQTIDALILALDPTIATAQRTADNATAGLTGNAVTNAVNLTETTTCVTPATGEVCRTLQGDPGFGAFRPCAATPPENNLLGQLLWTGVRAYEDLEHPAPSLCADHWDTLRDAAR